MIVFACASCQKKLSIKDELTGKKIKCPLCGKLMIVPTLANVSGSASTPSTPPGTLEQTQDLRPSQQAMPVPAHSGMDQMTQPMPTKSGATLSPHPAGADHDSSLTDFLAPPQRDDELGRLGGFRILKIIGHGGMGVVFQGEDPTLGRKVAIKAMLPSVAKSRSSQQRFLREAKTAATLEHDHIVAIHHVG